MADKKIQPTNPSVDTTKAEDGKGAESAQRKTGSVRFGRKTASLKIGRKTNSAHYGG